ncbi:MAG: penicillin-binding protein [Solirubrobacteraceae bacterium]|nr:penicillin-binding protein [Solirubrobacteraceae bacterium]
MASPAPPAPRRKTKIRWLRLMAILSFLGVLAIVSAVFGMMMAVASDLPEIDVLNVPTRLSYIVDRNGNDLGVLTGNQKRLLVGSDQISNPMKHAIVSIEDKRFYTNSGVDLRGIARAAVQDVVSGGAVQGASTIAQQLVKNRLAAQDDRTVFQKLREAAMAFHVTRKWSKDRILRNYLNTIYFGNGAYGIESAARTYFGKYFGLDTSLPKCGSGDNQVRCASLLRPAQAALIAGVVSNPSAYDPVLHPLAARDRRNLVLERMNEQGYLSDFDYQDAKNTPLPLPADIHPPEDTSKYPYFTTWVRQQVVDKVGAGLAFEGGLKIQTTIDSNLQEAAQNAITAWLGVTPGENGVPAASMVVLDNKTSEVLAMVGGNNDKYNERPFNLATQGQRQPGSSIKPFILTAAYEDGFTPYSTMTSAPKDFCVTYNKKKKTCTEHFPVSNFGDTYTGTRSLANALAFSDNSVFAQLGIEQVKGGTKRIAHLAESIGIRTPVSHNFAMTLGGLKQGVTVLDMAHAYESFASGGNLVYGTLSPGVGEYVKSDYKATVPGPVGIKKILQPTSPTSKHYEAANLLNGKPAVNKAETRRVIPANVAAEVASTLQGPVAIGTAKRAAISGVAVSGKTGTTENYGDAWFIGWSPDYTVAVWVGYPDGNKSMEAPNFSFDGEPVEGGTYPAAIWGTFVRSALAIYPDGIHTGPTGPSGTSGPSGSSSVSSAPAISTSAPVTTTAPTTPETDQTQQDGAATDGSGGAGTEAQPDQQAPAPPEQPDPQQPVTTAPAGTDPAGGDSGAGGASAPPG